MSGTTETVLNIQLLAMGLCGCCFSDIILCLYLSVLCLSVSFKMSCSVYACFLKILTSCIGVSIWMDCCKCGTFFMPVLVQAGVYRLFEPALHGHLIHQLISGTVWICINLVHCRHKNNTPKFTIFLHVQVLPLLDLSSV